MTTDKKYIARSYFFLLYQFLRHKYDKIEVVFISHTVNAKRVAEDEFFKRISIGGTMMSSALEMEMEVINKEYHPDSWNIYTFYAGDGENWPDDNEKTINLLNSLKASCTSLRVMPNMSLRASNELFAFSAVSGNSSPSSSLLVM